MMIDDVTLGRRLLDLEAADRDQLHRGRALQIEHGVTLYEALIVHRVVPEPIVVGAAASVLALPAVQLADAVPEPSAVGLLSAEAAHRLGALPVAFSDGSEAGGRRLVVAMRNPLDTAARDEIVRQAGISIAPMLVGPLDLAASLARAYPEADLSASLGGDESWGAFFDEALEAEPSAAERDVINNTIMLDLVDVDEIIDAAQAQSELGTSAAPPVAPPTPGAADSFGAIRNSVDALTPEDAPSGTFMAAPSRAMGLGYEHESEPPPDASEALDLGALEEVEGPEEPAPPSALGKLKLKRIEIPLHPLRPIVERNSHRGARREPTKPTHGLLGLNAPADDEEPGVLLPDADFVDGFRAALEEESFSLSEPAPNSSSELEEITREFDVDDLLEAVPLGLNAREETRAADEGESAEIGRLTEWMRADSSPSASLSPPPPPAVDRTTRPTPMVLNPEAISIPAWIEGPALARALARILIARGITDVDELMAIVRAEHDA